MIHAPTRRRFLRTAAGAWAGVQILPSFAAGANERIRLAFIGIGGRGWQTLKSIRGMENVELSAFADVDQRRAAEARREHPKVPFFADFRIMLEKLGKDFDAVVISTPDHAHHVAARWCLKAGKHVYVEKPLTHTVAEARDLVRLEAQTGLVCQMGNQGHSGSGILLLEEWVKAGVFGDVREAHAWSGSQWSFEDRRPPAEPVPQELDWDLWLGPAAKVPYSSQYLPGRWRGWFEFGTGTLGDWACHNMDAPYAVFGLDCPSKVEIDSTPTKLLTFPESVRLTFTFPAREGRGEFKIHWYQGPNHRPPRPADLEPDRNLPANGGTVIVGSRTTAVMGTHAGPPRIIPESKRKELASSLPAPDTKRSNHYLNWLLAIRGVEKARSPFSYGGRLTEIMHFGNIAMHLRRNLAIDPRTREILGDAEATALAAGPPPRDGWRI